MVLQQFTQPAILKKIGERRLALLLQPFAQELLNSNITLATPCPPNDEYYNSLAALLARPTWLPDRLRSALLAIERVAASDNREALDAAVERHLANVSIPRDYLPLERALDLWLCCPEGLLAVVPAASPVESCKLNEESAAADGRPTPTSPSGTGQSAMPTAHAEGSPGEKPALAGSAAAGLGVPDEFARLAGLRRVEYDRVRRAEAKRLGVRLRTLDEEVERARNLQADAEAREFILTNLPPWEEPIVDGPGLFEEVHERFELYLHLPAGAAVYFTLWLPHAQAIKAFTMSPRLNLTSAEPGCGKTTVLHLLRAMSHRALYTTNLMPAVLYRVIHLYQPVVLLDELDTYLHVYAELRGLLNAGIDPSATVWRCEGKEPRPFKSFAATALAGLGQLPATLLDRSNVIALEKAPRGALKARFDQNHVEAENLLGRKIGRWTQDHFKAIAGCDPKLPVEAYNRQGDKWRPLFAIAQVIGGPWPERVAGAFEALAMSSSRRSASQVGTLLLGDIRQLFAQSGTDRIFSSVLVALLRTMPERPWLGANNGQKPIDQRWLGRQLQEFGVAPHNVRIGEGRAKGYCLEDFTAVFAQILDREEKASAVAKAMADAKTQVREKIFNSD